MKRDIKELENIYYDLDQELYVKENQESCTEIINNKIIDIDIKILEIERKMKEQLLNVVYNHHFLNLYSSENQIIEVQHVILDLAKKKNDLEATKIVLEYEKVRRSFLVLDEFKKSLNNKNN